MKDYQIPDISPLPRSARAEKVVGVPSRDIPVKREPEAQRRAALRAYEQGIGTRDASPRQVQHGPAVGYGWAHQAIRQVREANDPEEFGRSQDGYARRERESPPFEPGLRAPQTRLDQPPRRQPSSADPAGVRGGERPRPLYAAPLERASVLPSVSASGRYYLRDLDPEIMEPEEDLFVITEPPHPSDTRTAAPLPTRSKLTPSQRASQVRPEAARPEAARPDPAIERRKRNAYVTYTVNLDKNR